MYKISGQVKLLIDRFYPLLSGEPGKYFLALRLAHVFGYHDIQ